MRVHAVIAAMMAAGCGGSDDLATPVDDVVATPRDGALEVGAEVVDATLRDASLEMANDTGALDSTSRDDALDASVTDARDDVEADAPAPPPPPPPPPAMGDVLYTADRTLSPITSEVAEALRTITRRSVSASDREFAKVGDSNTVSTNYLTCFAGTRVDLAGRTALQSVIDTFRMGTAGGSTPFDRVSLAATIGWSVGSAIAGSPSPVAREIAAIRPRQATVMFGTNDIQSRAIDRYAADMWTLTDTLLAAGVVPLFTSIPARGDNADADLWVPRYNAVARALAQSHRVPYIDTHRELATIPRRGLGPDNLHLNVFTQGGASRGCVFTAEGLQFGQNVRNLRVLETLGRVLDVTARAAPPPDRDASRLVGEGTPASPFAVSSLPFVDGRDTRASRAATIARYTGCASTADESGPEVWYRLVVTRPTRVRAEVFVRGTTDVDLHLLDSRASAAGCVQRDDKVITADLSAGTWFFVVDSYVAAGVSRGGEFLFTALAE
jgi:GDSL-like Lipase/Acylhydrolase family